MSGKEMRKHLSEMGIDFDQVRQDYDQATRRALVGFSDPAEALLPAELSALLMMVLGEDGEERKQAEAELSRDHLGVVLLKTANNVLQLQQAALPEIEVEEYVNLAVGHQVHVNPGRMEEAVQH